MNQNKVVITGATGLIGSRLVEKLTERGTPVTVLSRHPRAASTCFPTARFPFVSVVGYDPFDPKTITPALFDASAVVHLAGEPIAARWTPEVRTAIRNSREVGTRALVTAIAGMSDRPATLISASACRYYGVSASARFAEESPPGPSGDFLTDTTHLWEGQAQRASEHDVRVVILRFGITLAVTENGRAVLKQLHPFLGGRIGSGQQWVSWIHREDAVAILLRALDTPEMRGAYNATSPYPMRMSQVTDAFARASHSFFRVPVPSMVIRQLLGDGATIILDGQRVYPDRLLAEGFHFRFPQIGPAVYNILT
ncbi:TIGR01777 family oxidoreductase [Vreelandella boliviensis]|uniref:Epimerase family protein n=1 Tax=Vreelandella boliviensis LC1 TaxID=1072583 RepID=A0A265DZN9_9GAMM|nr:TIGR01777 family oxidoreductase [Halomonas boliviensis]EHJ91571.1 Epimerase family protein [Halomonas boliviensis LC1]OZT74792.1 TIGR01777 family protein [Halomonas boliviensis LC1]